jgi:hypothetical protein
LSRACGFELASLLDVSDSETARSIRRRRTEEANLPPRDVAGRSRRTSSIRNLIDAGGLAVLWLFIVIATLVLVRAIGRDHRARQEDFAVYYFLAQAMRQGRNPYATDIAKMARARGADIHDISRGTEPPTFLLLFEPIATLPLNVAYWTWQGTNLVCLVIAVFLLLGMGSELEPRLAATIAGLALLYPPVGFHFWMGQSKLPVLLLLALMTHFMERGGEAAAGLALALATLLRIFPVALLAYLILLHRRRVAAYTVAGLLMGSVFTVMFVGMANIRSFLASLSFLTGHWWEYDIALRSFVARTIWALYPSPALAPKIIRYAIVGIVDLSVVTMTFRATLMFENQNDPDWRVFSLWIATSVFLLPVAWDYDLTLMLIPFVEVARAAAQGAASRRAVSMAIVSYLLMLFWECVIGHIPPSGTLLRMTVGEGGFLSMAAAYAAAYWFAVDARGTRARPVRELPAQLWRRLAPAALSS